MATDEVNTKTDAKKLKNCIEEMDQLSQSGFSKINALSNIIRTALGNNKKPLSHRELLPALQQIESIALDHENLINCLAEEAGCNFRSHVLGGAQ